MQIAFMPFTVLPDVRTAWSIVQGAGRDNGSLGEVTFHRKLPGDGILDLDALLTTLARMDALGWVGPEVISPETAAMAPADAARLAGERVRALVASARGR